VKSSDFARYDECAILTVMGEFDVRAIERAISGLRETQANAFGSEEHGFRMNPVLSATEVAAFERDHKILLPSEYRQFIIELGNGGAGPFYGVFPLGVMDDNFDQRSWQENDGFVGMLSTPFPFKEEWNDLTGRPDEELATENPAEYDKQIEKFYEKYWSSVLVNGAVPISHEGCALRIWLVVTGEQAGKLWKDGRSESSGLKPVRLADGSAATFSEWYQEWLDECFASTGQANWR
jgi:hypothetical protein